MIKLKSLMLGVGLLLLSSFSFAQDFRQALLECEKETNDVKRLACYDSVVKQLSQSADVGQLAPPPPPSAPIQTNKQTTYTATTPTKPAAPELSAEERFGKSKQELKKAEELSRIDAIITKISKSKYGKMTITLSNGQKWRQTVASKLRLKVNQNVFIERGAFDSFILGRDGTNSRMRVKRVK